MSTEGAVDAAADAALADTALADGLGGSDTRAVRTALHAFGAGDAAMGAPGYHTLVLRLPREDFHLRLHDLRIVVLPAARGLRLAPGTLAAG